MRDQVLAAVLAAAALVCEVPLESLDEQTRLVEDIAADSLALVEIADVVETAIGSALQVEFHVDDEDLGSSVTLGDLVAHSCVRLGAAAPVRDAA